MGEEANEKEKKYQEGGDCAVLAEPVDDLTADMRDHATKKPVDFGDSKTDLDGRRTIYGSSPRRLCLDKCHLKKSGDLLVGPYDVVVDILLHSAGLASVELPSASAVLQDASSP